MTAGQLEHLELLSWFLHKDAPIHDLLVSITLGYMREAGNASDFPDAAWQIRVG